MEKKLTKTLSVRSLCVWAGFAAIFIMFLTVGTRFFVRTVLVGMAGVPEDNPIVAKILKNRMKDTFAEDITTPHSLSDVKTIVGQVTSDAESAIENDLLGRSIITRLVNRAENAAGISLGRFDGETLYNLNGYLLWAQPEKTDAEVAATGENVSLFCSALREKGLNPVYIMVPTRVCAERDWISGTVDATIQNHNRRATWLRENGIEVWDLLDTVHTDICPCGHHELFFRTDHHWTCATGIWVAQTIAGNLADCYGISVDSSVFDAVRYRVDKYEKAFLGSIGKKITEEKVVPDDFELWYPLFETDLTASFLDNEPERGDFSILYNMDYFDPDSPVSIQDPYSVYLRGNLGHVTIENNRAANDTRLLIIGDSYDNVVVPFLCLAVRSVDVFDLRLGDYGQRLWSLINGKQYDAVLVITSNLGKALE